MSAILPAGTAGTRGRGIRTMSGRLARALRNQIGSLRGARWEPVARGVRVLFADGRSYFVHAITERVEQWSTGPSLD